MIICPNCKEEIDNDSHYCDQCGQALLFCQQCGSVGLGRRCTRCGGLMVAPGAQSSQGFTQAQAANMQVTGGITSSHGSVSQATQPGGGYAPEGIPMLTLANDSLNIRLVGINGAVIGRRQGPYSQFFEKNPYVSGVHAQLRYKGSEGWCVADKHSSNGTRLNQRELQPDVEMLLHNGDILTIANVNLQVIVR